MGVVFMKILSGKGVGMRRSDCGDWRLWFEVPCVEAGRRHLGTVQFDGRRDG
jgi:hypothetical protein